MKQNNLIYIDITANSFLYHMVRNIVGSLVDIGLRKFNPSELKIIIDKRNRIYCSKMAPAHPLFLFKH